MKMVVIDTEKGLIKKYKEEENTKIIEVKDGKEMKKVIDENPDIDIAVAGVFMKGIGGAELCNEIRKTSSSPYFIVVSNTDSPNVVNKCMDFGVDQFIIKPYELDTMSTNIEYGVNPRTVKKGSIKKKKNISRGELRDYIRVLLTDMGISARLRGYDYIVDAVEIIIDHDGPVFITKDVYPNIAEMYNSKSSRVERCIRTAVKTSCERGNNELLYELFSYSIDKNKGFPTNTEFLFKIAEVIKLKYLNIEV